MKFRLTVNFEYLDIDIFSLPTFQYKNYKLRKKRKKIPRIAKGLPRKTLYRKTFVFMKVGFVILRFISIMFADYIDLSMQNTQRPFQLS